MSAIGTLKISGEAVIDEIHEFNKFMEDGPYVVEADLSNGELMISKRNDKNLGEYEDE